MGHGSEQMIANEEERQNKELAKHIGLSYDEFLELDYEIDTEESDDGMVFNYILKFSESSPKVILDRIKGLESGNYLFIPASDFENL